MQNVFVASEIMGNFNIMSIAPVKDLNSLKILLNKIKKEPSVNRVEIVLINDIEFPILFALENLTHEIAST